MEKVDNSISAWYWDFWIYTWFHSSLPVHDRFSANSFSVSADTAIENWVVRIKRDRPRQPCVNTWLIYVNTYTWTRVKNGVAYKFAPSSSPIKPKKRLHDESNWKKNVTKSKKAKGEEHLSHNSKRIISARKTGPPCECKKQCFAKIDDDQKGQILTTLNALGDKSLQDAYLKDSSAIA